MVVFFANLVIFRYFWFLTFTILIMSNHTFDEYIVKDNIIFGDAIDGLDSHYNKQLSKLTAHIKEKRLIDFITINNLFDNYYTLYKNNLEVLFNNFGESLTSSKNCLFYNDKCRQIKDLNQQLFLDTTENYYIDL